jgi:hypothetical protein
MPASALLRHKAWPLAFAFVVREVLGSTSFVSLGWHYPHSLQVSLELRRVFARVLWHLDVVDVILA